MQPSSVEQLFARYAREGAAADLAEVFDRTAPDLLRLALHLARDGNEAEDLLQSTFVAAIDRARTFEPDRPLVPWLCGILANKARQLASRRRPPDLVPRASVDPHPLDVLAGTEVRSALAAALAKVDGLYREPLALRFVHGLAPVEIARRLERSPGAVRVQLHRGLELLRRLLPPGLALSVPGLLATRGLASVRAGVLAHARRSVTAVSPLAPLGVFLMKHVIAVVGGVLLLALLLVPNWHGAGGGPPSAAATQTSAGASLGAGRDAGAGSRQEHVSPPAADREAVAEARGALALRARWQDTGEPAAGVALLVGERRSGAAGRSHEVVTAADGSARAEGVRSGFVEVRVAGGAWPATAVVRGGATTELTVDVPPRRRCHGRTIDPAGAPVAHALVFEISGPERPARHCATSDADGRFEAAAVAADANFVACAAGGLCSRIQQVLPDASGAFAPELVLEPIGADLGGRVVDRQDRGIAGAIVRIGEYAWRGFDQAGDGVLTHPPHFAVEVRCDADGNFAAPGLCARPTRIAARAPGHAAPPRIVALRPREPAHVVVRMDADAVVEGVVRAPDGSPIANAAVAVRDADHVGDVASAACDERGQFELHGLQPGVLELEAEATEYGYGRLVQHMTLAPGERRTWAPTLPIEATTSGVVHDAQGRAVAGAEVQAREVDGGTRTSGSSDVDGRFRLRLPPGSRWRLAATGPGMRLLHPCTSLGTIESGARDLVVVLPPEPEARSFLVGALVDDAGRPSPERLVAEHAGGATFVVEDVDPRTGRFRTPPLPPGSYVLRTSPERTFGPFVLLARETRDAGRLVATVPTDARPRGRLQVAVRRTDDQPLLERPGLLLHAPAARDGIALASPESDVPAGDYVLHVFGATFVEREQRVTITAGTTTKVELTVEPAVKRDITIPVMARSAPAGSTERFTIRRTDGLLVCEREVAVDNPFGNETRWWFAFPRGEHLLSIEAADGKRWQARFTVDSLEPSIAPIAFELGEVK
jgi:RNA polymerase sigma-70 factor (ECF subfamily)